MSSTHKRHFKNYLIDRDLQLRFTLVVVLISVVLTAGLGWFWYAETRKTSTMIEVDALASGKPDSELQKVEAELKTADQMRLLVLVGFGVVMIVLVAGSGIVLTHRVAGPLFKISRHMEDVAEGRLKPLWDLRRGDQLQGFWKSFKGMHEALREQAQGDLETLNNVVGTLEKATPTGEETMSDALEKLRSLRDRHARGLEEPQGAPRPS